MKKFNLKPEDYNTKFDPDTYQSSNIYQFYMYKYSVWFQFLSYHEAKKDYYEGKPKLSDEEFDRLEESLKRKYCEVYEKYSCVGFNLNLYKAVKRIFDFFDRTINERFVEPWNEYAESCKIVNFVRDDNGEFKESEEMPEYDEELEPVLVESLKTVVLAKHYEIGEQMELFA